MKLKKAAAIISTIVLITNSQPANAASKQGIKADFWKPLCELSEELDGKPGDAMHEVHTSTAKITQMRAAYLRAATYTAIHAGTALAETGSVVAAYFAAKETEGLAQLQQETVKTQIASATNSVYLKGRVDEFLSIMEQAQESASNACLLTNAGSIAERTHKTRLDSQECKLSLSEIKAKKSTGYILSATGYSTLKHHVDSADAYQHNAGAGCKLTMAHHTAGFMQGGASKKDFTMAAGYVTIPNDDTSRIGGVKLDALTDTTEQVHQPWISAWQAYKSRKGSEDAAYKNETDDLDKRNCLIRVIREGYAITEDSDNSKTKAVITRLFGSTSANKWDDAVKDIYNTPIKGSTAKQKEKANLGDITDESILTSLLTYYTVEANKKFVKVLQQANSRKQAAKDLKSEEEKEKECNEAKDDKDACTKLEGKGCVFDPKGDDGKKCTLSEETKQKAEKEAESQETGGTGGVQTGYVRKKTEDLCEANPGKTPKGKTKLCGWMNYVDGEAKLDPPQCFFSTYIVNKKLALMNAPFMSLLAVL